MIVVYIIVGLIVLLLLLALVIPKDMNVYREVIINKPVAEVFNYIKYLKNQHNYSKWARMDPNIKNEYRGTDGTVGFVNSWTGNKKVGVGEQEITGIDEGKALYTELRFLKPFKSISQSKMVTEPVSSNSTKVTWGFDSKMNYPMNLMKLFGMEKAIGRDFEIGLSNLKELMEK